MDASGLMADDRERLLYYRDARDKAEREWRQNNNNAEALTHWGVALFELAHFHQGTEAIELISQAVSKLEMALQINPKKHDALWFLGNALTSQGFLYPDAEKANKYFEKAAECYRRAVAEEPENEMYKVLPPPHPPTPFPPRALPFLRPPRLYPFHTHRHACEQPLELNDGSKRAALLLSVPSSEVVS